MFEQRWNIVETLLEHGWSIGETSMKQRWNINVELTLLFKRCDNVDISTLCQPWDNNVESTLKFQRRLNFHIQPGINVVSTLSFNVDSTLQ